MIYRASIFNSEFVNGGDVRNIPTLGGPGFDTTDVDRFKFQIRVEFTARCFKHDPNDPVPSYPYVGCEVIERNDLGEEVVASTDNLVFDAYRGYSHLDVYSFGDTETVVQVHRTLEAKNWVEATYRTAFHVYAANMRTDSVRFNVTAVSKY